MARKKKEPVTTDPMKVVGVYGYPGLTMEQFQTINKMVRQISLETVVKVTKARDAASNARGARIRGEQALRDLAELREAAGVPPILSHIGGLNLE